MSAIKVIINVFVSIAIASLVRAQQDATWLDSYNYYWSQNCDFFGRDIRVVTNTKWKECGAICKNDANCKFFSHVPVFNGVCYLKNSFELSEGTPRYGWTCGFVKDSAEKTDRSIFWRDGYYFYWAKRCDFPGHDIAFKTVANSNDCAEQCLRDGQCNFYTFDPPLRRCYLKTITDFPRKFKPSSAVPSTRDAVCGFRKAAVSRPTNPSVFWYDSELGFWGKNCQFSQPAFQTITGTTFMECQRECTNDANCSSFDWDDESAGKCQLMNTADFNPANVFYSRGPKCGFPKLRA